MSLLAMDFDDLLNRAKANLQQREQDQGLDHDADAVADQDDLDHIKQAVQNIPVLDPHLPKTNNTAPSSTGSLKFRSISDPVQVANKAKLDKEKTSGDKWFNMPKPEMTDQVKRDLQVLKMRHVWDPKRHYKKNNDPLPKYFQTGTVIQGNTEFFSARIARKDRKKTIAEELMADDHSYDYYRRKHAEVQEASRSGRSAHVAKRKRKLARK